PDDWMSVKVKFTPNLPADVLSEVQAAQQADGMLSQQTRLGMLSFLDDVQAEVDRLTEEQEELTAQQARAIYSDVDSMIRSLEAEGYTVMRNSDGEEDTAEE
ncbi:MAG: phage portal protein, partial [Sarcina sp.]|nr:phage portal protein [Sarcina sp.]